MPGLTVAVAGDEIGSAKLKLAAAGAEMTTIFTIGIVVGEGNVGFVQLQLAAAATDEITTVLLGSSVVKLTAVKAAAAWASDSLRSTYFVGRSLAVVARFEAHNLSAGFFSFWRVVWLLSHVKQSTQGKHSWTESTA